MPSRPTLHLLRRAWPGEPAFDTAVSRALLLRVGRGELPETLRLYRPDDVVAFSPLDAVQPGYAAAVAAAAAGGFGAVRRLAGGRAAVFHRETLAFAWCRPAADPREGIRARFDEMAELTAAALRRLGVDARVGEIPGEYCPGAHSVNARGRRKLMGVGQRLVRGAAHVGGVVVVAGGERVRDVLRPVYEALGVAWDPDTAGSVADEVGGARAAGVAEALLEAFAERYDLVPAEPDAETLALARRLAPEHVAEAGGGKVAVERSASGEAPGLRPAGGGAAG